MSIDPQFQPKSRRRAYRPLRTNAMNLLDPITGTKTCQTCGTHKYADQFSRRSTSPDGLREKCRICDNARRRFAKTGWSQEEFDGAWKAQKGKCRICRVGMYKDGLGPRSASSDHCHEHGHKRGLLCMRCNTAIGLLADNPQILARACQYVCYHDPSDPTDIALDMQGPSIRN